ncbi:uncharacterized protein UV8b_01197 [Ustilaginoidea virens]|uniref:Myb-like domain-containing protein n=1 Tax=Ustilaginoidea virens TaxID=1159556 RepID=A0A8E5MF08_USTVR|nr:uncharacterized protein UV8b_01197 [Ustilaginoidea virens]QUC16956.1 hypothetical protein UV8b_01197 [Ustilaginoidea virens]
MDSSASTSEAKSLPWTEEAKYQFLLRIVAQLRQDGKAISWQKINMPGRTPKSLQNMWTKINKTIAEMEQENGDATPVNKPSPRKKLPTKSKSVADQVDGEYVEDDDELPIKATPKKRGPAKSAGGSAKKARSRALEGEVGCKGDDGHGESDGEI